MKNISFLSENFQFLEVKLSIYLNRRAFIMEELKKMFWRPWHRLHGQEELECHRFVPKVRHYLVISWWNVSKLAWLYRQGNQRVDYALVMSLTQFFRSARDFKCQMSLRKHAYAYILKILTPKNENFQIKNSDIFHISAQNIDCWYSLEPPQRGGSNEYPQSMFWAEIRKIMYTPVNHSFTI